MDSWFTQAPLIKAITDKGLDVIGMVKQLKQRYQHLVKLFTDLPIYQQPEIYKIICLSQRISKQPVQRSQWLGQQKQHKSQLSEKNLRKLAICRAYH